MSADNWIILNISTFEVTCWQGEAVCKKFKCKTLEEAVLKAKELDEEYDTEYGVKLVI